MSLLIAQDPTIYLFRKGNLICLAKRNLNFRRFLSLTMVRDQQLYGVYPKEHRCSDKLVRTYTSKSINVIYEGDAQAKA